MNGFVTAESIPPNLDSFFLFSNSSSFPLNPLLAESVLSLSLSFFNKLFLSSNKDSMFFTIDPISLIASNKSTFKKFFKDSSSDFRSSSFSSSFLPMLLESIPPEGGSIFLGSIIVLV